jgi:hypothetical protein
VDESAAIPLSDQSADGGGAEDAALANYQLGYLNQQRFSYIQTNTEDIITNSSPKQTAKVGLIVGKFDWEFLLTYA